MNNLNSNICYSTMSKLPSKRNALDSKFSHYSLFLVQLSRKFSICRYNLHTFSLRYLALCCLRIPSSFERTMATDRVFVGSIAWCTPEYYKDNVLERYCILHLHLVSNGAGVVLQGTVYKLTYFLRKTSERAFPKLVCLVRKCSTHTYIHTTYSVKKIFVKENVKTLNHVVSIYFTSLIIKWIMNLNKLK